jgi:hypothetical protein
MPANTKAFRAKKIVSRRRVFVSWIDPIAPHRDWIADFWERLQGDIGALLGEEFDEPAQSFEAQSEAVEAGAVGLRRPDPAHKDSGVTDFVAVLSSRYINANTDFKGRPPSTGEMARFVDRVVKSDPAERVRVFLAPVDKPSWDLWRIRDFWLSDTKSNSWLIRLQDHRFTWRSEIASRSADEIADAVTLIICDKPRTG